jgi:hypothetical protein
MKRRSRLAISLAALLALSTFSPASAQTTVDGAAAPRTLASRVAPADEYFGPLKLSVLGIRNTINDTTVRMSAGVDENDTMRCLGLVEASVRDWEAKYPGDTWLPRIVYSLHHAYRKVATRDSLLHSIDVASWLMEKYPASEEAKLVRAELANGVSAPSDQDTGSTVATDDGYGVSPH